VAGLATPDKVRELQITLYRKAKAAEKHRFWSLYGEVQRADVLEAAWRQVAANGGVAGVDGIGIEMIPKANGGERPLGIPTVKDRVVQMAVYLVLMPIFKADFHPRSYGFRPQRNAHQAVEAIREALRLGKTEVVDADSARYFETIGHARLPATGRAASERRQHPQTAQKLAEMRRRRASQRGERRQEDQPQPRRHAARRSHLPAPSGAAFRAACGRLSRSARVRRCWPTSTCTRWMKPWTRAAGKSPG
jgi:hypothetical protein